MILRYYQAVGVPVLLFLVLGTVLLFLTRRKSAATRQFIASVSLLTALAMAIIPALPISARPVIPASMHPGITWHRTPYETVYIDLLPTSPIEDRIQFRPSPVPWASCLFALISAWLAIRLVGSVLEAQRLRKRAVPASDRVSRLTHRRVEVVESLSSPVALGGFRPIILLPAEAEGWSEDQLRAVLIHEEAHLVNGDPNWQVLAEITCLVFWFNPLAWYVRAQMRHAAERAADDAVIRAGIQPSRYAEGLIDIASRVAKTRQPIAWTTFARKQGVKERIRAILNARIERNPMKQTTKIVSVAALALAAYITSAYVRQDKNPTSPYDDVREGKTTAARASNGFIGRLADGRNIEVVQISRQMPNGRIVAWKPDGSSIDPSSQVKLNYHPLSTLGTHVRYVVFRFPEIKGQTTEPVAALGSGGPESGAPREMGFCGGGNIGHKDGFYTVVSYIDLPREDAERFPVSLCLSDSPWKDICQISPNSTELKNVTVKEVSKPIRGDLEAEPWWKNHAGPYTMAEYTVPCTGVDQTESRTLPVFVDPSTSYSEDNQYGSFGGYIQVPPDNHFEGLKHRYYFSYPLSAIKEFRYQTRKSLHCEIYDLAANPNVSP